MASPGRSFKDQIAPMQLGSVAGGRVWVLDVDGHILVRFQPGMVVGKKWSPQLPPEFCVIPIAEVPEMVLRSVALDDMNLDSRGLDFARLVSPA